MYVREEVKRREDEGGMVRRTEMPLPHANSSWGGGGAGGALHCQEEPQPSQHVRAQSRATISQPTQEQVELREGLISGGTDSALLQGALCCQFPVLQDSAKFLLITLLPSCPKLCLYYILVWKGQ